MRKLAAFLSELKRRRVFRVAVVYAGVTFIIFQVADFAFPALHVPDWFSGAVVVLLALGFLVAVGLAWAFDITEKGVVRTAAKGPERTKAPRRVLIGNKTLAIVAAVAVVVAVWSWWGRPAASVPGKSIAVLPFANLSDSKEDEYFSDGITEDIMAHLAKISDLTVIGRTSVMQYKGTTKRLRDIGEELGVATLLEGSVRRAGGKVRIVSQLIDASTEKHLWAETYDRDLTDIFAIQSDVAQRIAVALKATLTLEEKQRVEDRHTDNPKAYDYYLRGNEYLNRWNLDWLEMAPQKAIQLYEKAIQLDSQFALAYARMSIAHGLVYENWSWSEGRIKMARDAAEAAIMLAPDLPESHLAMGQYYFQRWEYGDALEAFFKALQYQPSHSDVLQAIAEVYFRQGNYERAREYFIKAYEIDPRFPTLAYNLGNVAARQGNVADAERFFDYAISLAPNLHRPYAGKADLYLAWEGDIDKARQVMKDAEKEIGPLALVAHMVSTGGHHLRVFGDEYQKKLDRLSLKSFGSDSVSFFSYYFAKGWYYQQKNQAARAQALYDSARVLLEERVRREPEGSFLVDSITHWFLAWVYAGLGRREEAEKEAEVLMQVFRRSNDYYQLLRSAQTYAMLGNRDAAFRQLALLASEARAMIITVDPIWDPIRDDPRFAALLK
ncbi:MAG: tetratricopeptide repeat protein [Calditrichaeota bacterium]|nr:tetratricopeptide repeat protein [Calditrichota bacterium]